VPIDLFSEQTLPLSAAAKRLPRLRNNRPVSPATLWRWASAGLRGVRLEVVKIGGATCTSVEALQRFFSALNGDARPAPAARQSRHDEQVERELAARGI
jgi:hypothetical protein